MSAIGRDEGLFGAFPRVREIGTYHSSPRFRLGHPSPFRGGSNATSRCCLVIIVVVLYSFEGARELVCTVLQYLFLTQRALICSEDEASHDETINNSNDT